MNYKKIFGLCFLSITMIIFIQSCKKNNNTQPSSQLVNNTDNGKYYMNGSVNGTDWKADVVVAGDTAGLMIVVGVQIQGTDTSLMAVIFKDNTTLNQSTDFNPSEDVTLGYEPSTLDASNVFAINTSDGATGTFTVTSLDKSADMVGGTFNATLINANTGEKTTVTNGTFYMPYYASESPTTGLPGNLKY
jgi:hypothetical protein